MQLQNLNSKRIIKNSILLYVRMLFTMWINLYATRLTLNNLGINDYGTYGVVGSVVNMFAVLTSGINSAIQRFISYELGKKDGDVNTVFCTALNLIYIIVIITFIILESVGLFFLTNKLNIPQENLYAANIIFHLSVITCLFTIMNIPYNSMLIAYERFDIFALISTIQVILGCVIAYSLVLFSSNRLIWYGIGTAIVSILIQLFYWLYCKKAIPNTEYKLIINKQKLREIGNFTGITTLDGGLRTVAEQGIIMTINILYGVSINATYSIFIQLKNLLLSFTQNVQKAFDPQIIKTYAEKNINDFLQLIYWGTKIRLYMFLFLAIPFILETELILKLWLSNVPDYTNHFAFAAIFTTFFFVLEGSVYTAAFAIGRIKFFLIIPDLIYLFTIPLLFSLYHFFNFQVNSIAILLTSIYGISSIIKMLIFANNSTFDIMMFIKRIIYPSFMVCGVTIPLSWTINTFLPDDIIGLISLVLINSLILLATISFIGLTQKERNKLYLLLNSILKKKHGK